MLICTSGCDRRGRRNGLRKLGNHVGSQYIGIFVAGLAPLNRVLKLESSYLARLIKYIFHCLCADVVTIC